MPFSSTNFLFILPVLVAVYWLLPRNWRRFWLVVSSLVVYMAAGWRDLFLLWAVTAANWASYRVWPESRRVRHAMIAFNLLVLMWFKYRYFIADNVGYTFATRESLIIPLGLSFYIFQLISYQVEILQGLIPKSPSFLSFLLYIFFFPHHQSGPIMRPHLFLRYFREGRPWRLPRFQMGLLIMLWGLFKKIWIADFLLAGSMNALYRALETSHGAQGNVLLLAVGYGIQIYADFSGYSDIAVGLGRMFGFRLDRNFHQPYITAGPSEFWRRWHVTLSSWLRDFLYIPLGGNRKGEARTLANLLIVMLLGGLWHGAAWTFVVWGFLHGLYLVIEKVGAPLLERVRTFKYLLFQFLFMLSWLPFRASRFGDIVALVRRYDAWVSPETVLALVLFAAIIGFSYMEDYLERHFIAIFRKVLAVPDFVLAPAFGAALYLLLVGVKYESMFIYQRF